MGGEGLLHQLVVWETGHRRGTPPGTGAPEGNRDLARVVDHDRHHGAHARLAHERCRRRHRDGCDDPAPDVEREKAEAQAADIAEKYGVKTYVTTSDVTDADPVNVRIAELIEEIGVPDIL